MQANNRIIISKYIKIFIFKIVLRFHYQFKLDINMCFECNYIILTIPYGGSFINNLKTKINI